MAVGAFYRVDVVETLPVLERRVHGFNVEAAIGELRMTGGAARAGRLAVLFMARKAAQAFVDAQRRAIVTGADLSRGVGGVTLITKGLARVGTDFHGARALVHLGQGKTV